MGETVSYVLNKNEIEPFIPFGYDDEGGISIIVFPSNPIYPHGDIIIDGGFTKLLYELETEGTERYILNIISWTTQYSRRYDELKVENWTEIKMFPSFEFNIDETVIWNGFVERFSPEFDIVYMVDATGSMSSSIRNVKDQCIEISNALKNKYPKLNFNFGAIFYRDPVDSPSDQHDSIPLTNDMIYFQNRVEEINAYGGNDDPEDWVGAFKKLNTSIAWRNGIKLIIHIADAPAHGKLFCGYDNYNEEETKLPPLLEIIAKKKIKIYAFQLNSNPLISFNKCSELYKSYGGLMYEIKDFSHISSDEMMNNFKNFIIEAATCAAPKDN